jgi:hypothetical protein
MANGFYAKGMKHIGKGELVWLAAGGSNVKVCLIDLVDYTVDLVNHEFRNPAISGAGAIEELSGNLTLIDAADDGILDASDITFTATAGDSCGGIAVFKDTGTDTTSPLLFWWDTASGLPVTLGGDVTVQWDNGTNKIAKI